MRILSIHEYKLKSGVTEKNFEQAVKAAIKKDLFVLPGLVDYHFLRRIRGTRQTDFAAIWIYQDKNAWEQLWGKTDSPSKKEEYPEKWQIWENEILAPLLREDPDQIYYAAYEVLEPE